MSIPLKPYKAEDIDLAHLSSFSEAKLGVKLFNSSLRLQQLFYGVKMLLQTS